MLRGNGDEVVVIGLLVVKIKDEDEAFEVVLEEETVIEELQFPH